MVLTHKDINLLSQKAALSGTEKIPVSDTEYIVPNQIAALAKQDVFIAIYGTTLYTEIASAINARKIVFCYFNKTMYIYSSGIDDFPDDLVFTYTNTDSSSVLTIKWITVTSSNVWANGYRTGLTSNSIDTSISAQSSDSHVPSSKCVYTSLQEKQKAITISSSEPTAAQGNNGDIWIVI